LRQRIATPSYMLIWAGEDQFTRIQGGAIVRIYVEHDERHSSLRSRCHKLANLDGWIKAQKRELLSQSVVE